LGVEWTTVRREGANPWRAAIAIIESVSRPEGRMMEISPWGFNSLSHTMMKSSWESVSVWRAMVFGASGEVSEPLKYGGLETMWS
jgi:uncharacterized protein YfaA (DUF2138 family)